MADLNALIAQGYQFQPLPDPFAQYGKMQQLQNAGIQNQLTQQQLAAVQRAEAQTNALNEAYRQNTSPDTGEINYSGVRNYLSQQGAGSQIPALEKQRMELATQKLTQQKLEGEIGSSGFDLKIKKANKAITDIASLNSPEEAIASIDAHVKKGDIDSDKAAQLKSMLNSAPSFGAWQKSMVFNILDAKERLTADLAREGQGVTMRGQDIGAATATRGQDIGAATATRGQDIGAATADAARLATIRGQDIGAATATRGQDIGAATADAARLATIRGQDVGAATATRGQDIGAATATRGQDIGAATATRGQDIGAATADAARLATIRGQDVGAATAKAGQAVTMRGQNLVDARAQENLLVRKEDQRRAADPAFQQQLAEAKSMGQNMAKDKVLRATQLPKVLDTAAQTLAEVDTLIGKRDKDGKLLPGEKPHPGFENAVGATFLPGARFVPGTDAANFQARFDQIKGGAFLQAFETLKGGGSITNIEGEKGTAALNRMSLAQSEKEFVQASREFQDIVRTGVARAKKIASETPAGGEWKVVK